MDEVLEAGFDFDGFENGLALGGAAQEGPGNQVGHAVGIMEAIEAGDDFLDGDKFGGAVHDGQFLLDAFADQIAHLGHQGVNGDAVAAGGFEGADAGDAEGAVLDGLAQFDAGKALQDEMRGAVGVGDADADQAQAGDVEGQFAGAAGAAHGDDEEAVAMEDFVEHLAVARLKNMEREQGLGKKSDVGQRHDRRLARNIHAHNVNAVVPDSKAEMGACQKAGFGFMLLPVKDKAPIIVLIVVAVGLAVGLIVVNNKASQEKKEADDNIKVLSNTVVSTKASLAESQVVNQALETNLATTKAEDSNKLAVSEANLRSTEADLEKARAEAKAKAEADAAALAQRDKKIGDLEGQNLDLDRQSADLRSTITGLTGQIEVTKKKLAQSQGDRTLLLAELKRLQAQKDELERKFNDLAALRLQVRKLKQEASMSRQLDWMRRGVYQNVEEKGGAQLMKHPTNEAAPSPTPTLNVELRQNGEVKVQRAPATNSPAK